MSKIDYSKGKIYTIVENETGKPIYVGSTLQQLSKRWHQHKKDTERKTHLIQRYMREKGIENFHIELYEIFPCSTKEELVKKEYEVIRLLKRDNDLKNKCFHFEGKCEHNTGQYRCKECVGAGICEHKRDRYICKDCKGAGMCHHGKEKRYCSTCSGCIHNNISRTCTRCKKEKEEQNGQN